MKTSTSRDSHVKHSTGSNDVMTGKAGHHRPRPRTSTGVDAAITHVTGKPSGLKGREEAQETRMAKRKPRQVA